jgi:WD domain, G-beta repeat
MAWTLGAGLAACTSAPPVHGPRAWFAAAGERAFAVATLEPGDGTRHWLVAGGRPAEHGCAMVFAADGRQLASIALGTDVAYALAVAGPQVAVAMANGEVLSLVWPELRPTVRWRHARPAVAVAFSPDATWLASGGADGVVQVGPVGAATPAFALEHAAPVTCLAWAADGQRLVAGTRDGKVRLHDRSGRLLRTWNRLGGEVVEVAWVDDRPSCRVRATPIAAPAACPLPWP